MMKKFMKGFFAALLFLIILIVVIGIIQLFVQQYPLTMLLTLVLGCCVGSGFFLMNFPD